MVLHETLHPITTAQKNYAIKHLFEHQAWCSGKHIYCMECGQEITNSKCSCGYKHKTYNTLKRKADYVSYYAIVDRCKNFQVIRYFCVIQYYEKFHKANYEFHEIAQAWIDENFEQTYVTRYPSMFGYYNRFVYTLTSNFEIRKNIKVVESLVYEHANLIPAIKQRISSLKHFNKHFDNIDTLGVINLVCNNSHYETLYKACYFEFINYGSFDKIKHFWKQLCICIRNNYHPEDVSIWFDMLEAQETVGCDIHNPKFVCPDDLNAMHDLFVKKREKQRMLREKAERISEIKSHEAKYTKDKSKYFGIIIKNKDITIRPLQSVSEFFEEGSLMHHCIFANEYYKRKNSLILSAKIGDERIATIEYDLKANKIVQCRGYCNKTPEHYDEIINLINDNKRKIIKHERAN